MLKAKNRDKLRQWLIENHAKKLKKQVTINLDADTVDYFKAQSAESGIPYQTLINLYLSDCAANKRRLSISWN